jgi:hypothetical protein
MRRPIPPFARRWSAPAVLLLGLSLAACARPPVDAAPAGAQRTTGTDVLAGYHWRLQDATDAGGRRIDALLVRPDQPLQLDFADGRIAIGNACNHIGGPVRIDGEKVVVAQLVSTKRACVDPALAALDAEISRRIRGTSSVLVLESAPPQLQWTTADGDVLRFLGEPTPQTRYGGPGTLEYLEVAARTEPCQRPLSPVIGDCLKVRVLRYDAQGVPAGAGPWQPFQQTIEGYTHEPGIRNILRVRRFAIPNAPMDTPQLAYVLDAVIESSSETP